LQREKSNQSHSTRDRADDGSVDHSDGGRESRANMPGSELRTEIVPFWEE
jgi:hypothetical protein